MTALLHILIGLLSLITLGNAGNYQECSANYCENNGQCLSMSGSVYHYQNDGSNGGDNFDNFFIPNGNQQSWYTANNLCREQNGELINVTTTQDLSQVAIAAQLFIKQNDFKYIEGFWVGIRPRDNLCYVLDSFGILSNVTCSDTVNVQTGGIYLGLCHRLSAPSGSEKEKFIEEVMYYGCQCPENYGYENCSYTDEIIGSIQFGYTYCQKDLTEEVQFKSASDEFPLIFLDYAAYGRPLASDYSSCSVDLTASNTEEYCVASNSLAAITYWCQGKPSCKFQASWLINSHLKSPEALLYIQNQGLTSVQNYLDAVQSCQDSHNFLAKLDSREATNQALELMSRINSNLKGFWIDAYTKDHFQDLDIHASGHMQDSCLVLLNDVDNVLKLQWESCYDAETQYGALCQVDSKTQDFGDNSCFDELTNPVLEYRYHFGKNLNTHDVNCPMEEMLMRRGNTCYKTTHETDWNSARVQCWNWGGELAFLLPADDPECRAPVPGLQHQEYWLAGTKNCFEARCPIAFNNGLFEVGAFGNSSDICFASANIDSNNSVLRKGLCALPVAMSPRTPLPPFQRCPRKFPGDEGWPFPNYTWPADAASGETSTQPCPSGQSGNATWQCGPNGDWIDFPDLSNCSKIDTDQIKKDLAQNDSVPSLVINNLYNNVTNEAELGAGDIRNILDVLDYAYNVQVDRLESEVSDPSDYADQYTKESITLLSDILDRPQTWFGIPPSSKNLELSKLQVNLDNVAKSLLKYSSQEEHQYNSTSLEVIVKKQKSDSTSVEYVNQKGDKIQVISQDLESSVSFYGFTNFGCISDGKYECETVENVSSSPSNGVIGASLFRNNAQEKPKEVLLTFRIQNDTLNITDRNCVFWDVMSNTWQHDGCQLVSADTEETVCRCDHLTNFGVIMDINGILQENVIINALLTWLTIVGCSLSIVSLIICIYIFTAIRGLRTDRTTIHRNLCLCLLLAELLLLIGLDATDNPGLCGTVAGFLHYLFLASFAWMLVEGIDVYLMLVKVFDTGRSMTVYFYAIGYGAPAFIVILSVIIVEASGSHGYGTDLYCWLDTGNGLIWAFVAPIICVLITNSVMFFIAIRIARRSIQKRGESGEKTMALIKGSLSLVCILGITWIFGFFYIVKGTQWLSIIFTLLNSLQGFFIFLFHVFLNEKAKAEFARHIRSKSEDLKSYFTSKGDTTPRDLKDTSATDTVTTRASRKISNITSSTDVQTKGTSTADEKVKYYRGQTTIVVTSEEKGK